MKFFQFLHSRGGIEASVSPKQRYGQTRQFEIGRADRKASALRVVIDGKNATKSRKEMEMFGRLTIAWRPFWLSGSILAVAACAYQPPPPGAPPAAAAAPPATTTYFDGTYIGGFTQNLSAPGSNCPNFPAAPSLTINNGVARFAALDLTYQGYVTPDGAVSMQSPEGRTFMGQIDAYYVLRGQTTGACVYNAQWQRKGAGQGPKPGT